MIDTITKYNRTTDTITSLGYQSGLEPKHVINAGVWTSDGVWRRNTTFKGTNQ